MSGFATTVTGDIPTAELGVVLPHEHVFIDFEWVRERHTFDGVLYDEDVMVEELGVFRDQVEVGTIVDVTVPHIGRDAAALRRVSERTGLHVVMGCGWYREPYYRDDVDPWPIEHLVEQLVAECEEGVDGTGIRPGVIGEIGSHKGFVSGQEERCFRAAARAAARTGLAVTTHSVPDLLHTRRTAIPVGLWHLNLLEAEGVDPARVAVGHCDSWMDRAYHRAIAERGAFVQFDNIGQPGWGSTNRLEEQCLDHIVDLAGGGHLDRILLSHDVCRKSYLGLHGGNGFGYLTGAFSTRLTERGFTEAEVRQLLMTNPQRLLERS